MNSFWSNGRWIPNFASVICGIAIVLLNPALGIAFACAAFGIARALSKKTY